MKLGKPLHVRFTKKTDKFVSSQAKMLGVGRATVVRIAMEKLVEELETEDAQCNADDEIIRTRKRAFA